MLVAIEIHKLVLAFLAEAIEEIESEVIADDILSRLEGWLMRHRG